MVISIALGEDEARTVTATGRGRGAELAQSLMRAWQNAD
jgi:hypothetical protein